MWVCSTSEREGLLTVNLALRVVKLAFLDLFEELFWLFLFNLLVALLGLLILPLPLMAAGLAWVAAEIGQGKAIGWRTFVEGARRYWKPAYLWGLINAVTWVIIIINYNFYSHVDATWAIIPFWLLVSISLIWGVVQLYVLPLLILQEAPSLRLAYRNGLVLMASQPAVIIVLLILIAVLAAATFFLPILAFVVDFAFIALLVNRAVLESVKVVKEREAR
jgi:uncharacterized membrane protein YesL